MIADVVNVIGIAMEIIGFVLYLEKFWTWLINIRHSNYQQIAIFYRFYLWWNNKAGQQYAIFLVIIGLVFQGVATFLD